MTEPDIFFQKIIAQYQQKCPFVVYRQPEGTVLKSIFQEDSHLHTTKNYQEKGFVFAPFDDAQHTVLFPMSNCNLFEVSNYTNPIKHSSKKEESSVNNSDSRQKHIALVKKGIETIKSGTFQKVVLSRKISIKNENNTHSEEIVALFQKLEALYPTAFVYCWFHPKVGLWLGATPERLVSVSGKKVKTMALAGTQKHIEKSNIDWGEKERKEQQMVTDFITNALQSVSSNISVGKTTSHRAGQLVHLKNDIEAVLSDGNDLKNLIQQLHPTPAVCGLPKEKAKRFILENEHYNRTFYTGFLGECNMSDSGDALLKSDFYVNLRCMQLDEQSIHIYVGGGITKDSDPEAEWQETVNKAQTMLAVL